MAAARIVPSANTILEVLNLHNYEDWSSRIKTYLKAKGLWEVVKATAEAPSKEDGTEYRDWKKKNAKAHHAIKNSCGTDVFGFIRDSRTAKDAWATLAKMFKPVTASNNTDKGSAGLQLKDLETHDVIKAEIEVDDHQERNIYEPFFKYLKGDHRLTGFSALEFLKQHLETVRERHPSSGMPALHLALSHWRTEELAMMMVQLMTAEDLDILDPSGRTALSYALSLGDTPASISVAVAKCMVEKNERLPSIVDPSTNMIPVVMAHASANYRVQKVAPYLFSVTPLETMCVHQAAELISTCLRNRKLEIPMHLLDRYPSLGITEDLSGQSPLYTFADNRWGRWDPFFNGGVKLWFWEQWIYDSTDVPPINAPTFEDNPSDFQDFNLFSLVSKHFGVFRIRRLKIMHVQVLTVLDLMCEVIRNKTVAEMQESSLLKAAIFRAAKTENVGFIRRLLRENRRVLEITNGNDRTVLQFAADYRLEKVYNLIHEHYGYPWDICSRRDKFDNNMLHIVGSFSSHAQARIGHIQGAILKMQREVQWFLGVMRCTPPDCSQVINQTDQLRPVEVFVKYHKDLMKEGEMSMNKFATSFMVLGALNVITTVEAAFKILGGNNGDTGFPMFSKRKAFMIYIVFNAISFFSSATLVMILWGTLASRYKWTDFRKSLPAKMIAGHFTVYFSAATTMIAFCAYLYMVHEGKPWSLVLDVLLVLLLSILFAASVKMQFPFVVEICKATYGRSFFEANSVIMFQNI